ncbi:flippase [Kyrpidia spormannii]|uniref:O-antigen transporter n=2 Tax=Kyrpidia spormannii TaxID=2055160 RepID=A0ACA8Z5N9_9BACL|nr:flippase [Kyrpidia spormannii]CAB3389560.1 O-antigen transporter [Kyrpidia spormannii]CAB3390410.1 O-antigen transporter [Kyrpidia spormannii]
MPTCFSGFLRHALVHNVLALYGVNIANYFFPLITVPYLARVLGPEEWGMVAFAQAFGQYINLVVEYGFDLSATREVARTRDSLERRADLIAGVLGAKVVLASIVLGVVFVICHWVPPFREHSKVLWAGVFWALAMAFTLRWYFQGLERMRLVAVLDVSAKALAVLGILLLVQGPKDGWKVLVLQGVGSLAATLMTFVFAYREVPVRLLNWGKVTEVLRLGWTMFLFRSSVSLYSVGNSFVLGLFAPPQVVAYYAGAEKISKAFLGFLGPITQALYPRLSYLAQSSRHEAARLARIGVIVMALSGAFTGLVIFVSASLLVRILLGEGYDAAVGVLRLLALLPPLIALSNVLGIQWMLPLGLDRPFNIIILVAGVLNLCLAVILAPHFAELGMAWAVVVSEAFVTASMYLVLRRSDLDPITYTGKAKGDI